MDRSAIEAIADKNTLIEINEHLVQSGIPVAILPENARTYKYEDLDRFRSRFRGLMSTSSINDFGTYVELHKEEHSACFIDIKNTKAAAVLNLGNKNMPGHCDHRSELTLKKTSGYDALMGFHCYKHSQKEFTEWLEDWSDNIKVLDGEENPLELKKAIGALRRLTIDAHSEQSHTEENFKSSRSTLESVEAKSKGNTLPAWLEFTVQPFADFEQRTIRLRVSVLTGGSKPVLIASIVGLEVLKQSLAEEFQQKVEAKLDGIMPTYLGVFSA
ncbi:DUF2303 family protein [Candidatus Sororendozoicomonas aggregata]|uniref:DUF2303 family protein n=1 Tax=Candidatus Sororendozoicomonas aggregata TaxID=3073239 RepID=UPI002ED5193A